MIPAFPEFKPLELSDRAAVEAVVHSFPPYSDFNFTNLYAWDRQVSSLHGNLAVRNSNYGSEAPFFTFIGRRRLAETAIQLVDLAKAQSSSAVLRLIPECVARALAEAGFVVTADDAANDYVYAVDHIAGMHEWTGHSIRRRIRQFSARHPNYSVRHAPLHTIDTDEFRALFKLWAARKGNHSPQSSHEYRAFERFLRLKDANIETVGLYVDARLVGFSSFELLSGGMALAHFSKADNAFHGGICNVLYWEEAKRLQTRGVKHYNWEQDLGLKGLQQSKKKYRPCHFLKKFTVRKP
ncbi:MAG: phosphatidylglycerol lysyltransferase domain-containing protein [Rhodocyclaceae bacterium]|nr:phosphatidylglycerol lysyltransferase domain-containing protein [Rhodocyclaceae bacterium]